MKALLIWWTCAWAGFGLTGLYLRDVHGPGLAMFYLSCLALITTGLIVWIGRSR